MAALSETTLTILIINRPVGAKLVGELGVQVLLILLVHNKKLTKSDVYIFDLSYNQPEIKKVAIYAYTQRKNNQNTYKMC